MREITGDVKVRLLDIRQKMLDSGNLAELMCIDGIHPNEKGHGLIYEAACEMI